MKKYLLSLLIVIAFVGYVLYQRGTNVISIFNENDRHPVTIPSSLASPVSTSESLPSATGTPPATVTPRPQTGMYKDGSYTGPVTDAYYGNVQVKAVIKNGKISDVQFLQYPNDRGTSREINGQAMPYLTQEAIQAQNANVDIISGATQTSIAFRESLASALSLAKI